MITVFADSSALVKLYANEAGSDDMERLIRTGPLFVSGLARVEVPAALWRKRRSGELSTHDARILAARFSMDFHSTPSEKSRFISIIAAPRILDSAAGLTARHGLRAYDAVQLASAVAIRDLEPLCRTFACFDRGLGAAARAEGFAVSPAH
jgi:predicted nucleic acid-binding protein